jgi:hypothetical protein
VSTLSWHGHTMSHADCNFYLSYSTVTGVSFVFNMGLEVIPTRDENDCNIARMSWLCVSVATLLMAACFMGKRD